MTEFLNLPFFCYQLAQVAQIKIIGMSTKTCYLIFFFILTDFFWCLPTDTISSTTQATPSSATRKKPTKKSTKSNGQNGNNASYEHHLEKWLENTSKMNFDSNNLDGNWPFINAPNAFQQQPTNRKGNNHLHQFSSNDPLSLPSHIVSFCDF